jgi:quercetin dioxygenase-like cupin family protein
VFCLRGQLEYQVENQRFSLESGDSLLFSAKSHHRWRNTGKTVVNAIIVLSGFGHGEHPSEFHLASGIKSEEENPHPE